MRRRFLFAPLSIAAILAAGLVSGSCDGNPVGTGDEDALVPINVTAFAIGTPVSTLVIEVTAADINRRLVFNLEIVAGVARGIIEVPAGEARTFDVTAYDDHHNITHTGSETVDVNPGSNPPLKVKLKPVAGEVDIQVTFGDYSVVVAPAAVEFTALGETVTLVATVFDQYDEEVPDAQVVWATTHPTIASVSPAGLVTALAEGEATIVATYAGVAGIAEVTVFGEELCDGVDNDGDGEIDEGLMYCIEGAPAPNSDGANSCLAGWYDLDADPTNGCEVQNLPPVADAKVFEGPGYWVDHYEGDCSGYTMNLSGTDSYDPEGQPLSYKWRVLDAYPPGITWYLPDSTSATPTFSPDNSGEYVIGLLVFDGLLYSPWDDMEIICW